MIKRVRDEELKGVQGGVDYTCLCAIDPVNNKSTEFRNFKRMQH